MPSRFLLLATLLASAAGCSNKMDQAAKARIFSPEDPAADVQRAAEALKVADAATDGAVWERLWDMDRLEVTHRIGAHKAHASVHFRWVRGDRAVELTEDQSLETDAKGEFHATVLNDQDSGLEFVWVDGKAYARGRYGPFHVRRSDRAQQDAFREQASSALRTVFGLFKRRLHGTVAGSSDVKGHAGTRFALALGPAWGPQDHTDSPKAVFGQARSAGKDGLHPGPDEDTAHRLELDEREEPEKASGEIVVDRTGVILKGSIKGRFKVADPQQHSGASLEVEVTYDLQPAASQVIEPPKDVLTMKLPHAVNDPLWFTASNAPAAPKDEEEDQDSKIEEGHADDDGAAPATATHPTPAKPASTKTPPAKATPVKPAPAKLSPPRRTPAGH